MAIITIDSATFCHGPEVADSVAERLQFARLEDEAVFAAAAELAGLDPAKLVRIVYGPPSIFPIGARDTAKGVAALRVALIEAIGADRLVYHGLLGPLLSTSLTHVMRVCLARRPGLSPVRGGATGRREARRQEPYQGR